MEPSKPIRIEEGEVRGGVPTDVGQRLKQKILTERNELRAAGAAGMVAAAEEVLKQTLGRPEVPEVVDDKEK